MTTRERAFACTIGWTLSLGVVVLATLPLDLQNHPHWQRVAWMPFASGIVRPRDLVINTLLYMPLGYSMQACSARDRHLLVLVFAFSVSVMLELAQVYSHSRFPSATDVVMNTTGALLGAAIAERARRQKQKEPGGG